MEDELLWLEDSLHGAPVSTDESDALAAPALACAEKDPLFWPDESRIRDTPTPTEESDSLFKPASPASKRGKTEAAPSRPSKTVPRSEFLRTVSRACHAALEACPDDMMVLPQLLLCVRRGTQHLFDVSVVDAAMYAIDIAVAAGAFVRHHSRKEQFVHKPLDAPGDYGVRTWIGLASRRGGELQTKARAAKHRQLGNVFDAERNALLKRQRIADAIRRAINPQPGTAVFLVSVPGHETPLFVHGTPASGGVSVLALTTPPCAVERVA
jgi:hypothetical protein